VSSRRWSPSRRGPGHDRAVEGRDDPSEASAARARVGDDDDLGFRHLDLPFLSPVPSFALAVRAAAVGVRADDPGG
jgi:hypothetical protein